MSSQRYTPEFKQEAVRQVIERGYSVADGRRKARCIDSQIQMSTFAPSIHTPGRAGINIRRGLPTPDTLERNQFILSISTLSTFVHLACKHSAHPDRVAQDDAVYASPPRHTPLAPFFPVPQSLDRIFGLYQPLG